ncbi:MAG: GHMP family kinase ATP-binding protein [Candidatus Micrarchaeaceae archaeon]
MNNEVISIAYPTIPIIFLASADKNRVPLHDTMGLAVTDLNEETRSETKITAVPNSNKIEFLLEGKPIDGRRHKDIKKVVNEFMSISGKKRGLKIESKNYKIYSGSSDSGAAALVVGLNELFGTKLSKEKLAEFGNQISESAIRSVYGGMNSYIVSEGKPHGKQMASEKELKNIRIFAMGFDYETRVSAQEIFNICRLSPFWKIRTKMVPHWRKEIEEGLKKKNWVQIFYNAEQNCANAHYLIENGGKRCRRKEMMNAVIDVEEIRESGLPVYWTAGGGRVINTFSWGSDATKVLEEMKKRGQRPTEYKVAPGARVISSK